MPLHMIKLCVGCDTVEELAAWRRERGGPEWRLHTRQTPKRAAELLAGGSLYRVFRGMILCRQAIRGVETVTVAGQPRCEIVLDETVVRVTPTPRRAFQGWRYLEPEDAPKDALGDVETPEGGDTLPPALLAQLREIGAW